MHARLRTCDGLLSLAKKQDVQVYRTSDKLRNEVAEARKLIIQERFKKELNLLIAFPKSGGSGTTTDGNTARRVFENWEKSAAILELDPDLIRRLAVITSVLNSGLDIDAEKYDTYAMDTAKLWVELYPWYYMTPTIHKILVHGKQIIENSLLPIGMFSEEPQETSVKVYRGNRREFSRKCSRVATNTDVMHRMLYTSDPVISSFRKLTKPKSHDARISEEINSLIK